MSVLGTRTGAFQSRVTRCAIPLSDVDRQPYISFLAHVAVTCTVVAILFLSSMAVSSVLAVEAGGSTRENEKYLF